MDNITHDIVQQIGILSISKSGWSKELNLVSWNGAEPKYDIREWSPDHTKMGKGLTFNKEEILVIKALISEI